MAQQGYNIHDLSQKIANFAKITSFDIFGKRYGTNPANKEAYIASFDTKTKIGYLSQIIIVNQSYKQNLI
jgi:hypothetical protein